MRTGSTLGAAGSTVDRARRFPSSPAYGAGIPQAFSL